MSESVERDLAAIARIEAVPTILRTVREVTGLRFMVVARVLPDRWVACAVHDEIEFGLKVGGELDVATTLCSEVRDTSQPVVIEHASADSRYASHHTPKLYGFESYVAVPIFRRSGAYSGTLCGLDPQPRSLADGKTLSMLNLFSELIALQLEAEERHEGSRAELNDQREAAKLREQFIAVLGHDVRNPLASIATGTELLLSQTESPRERRILERLRSSTQRIGALVDDVLDLARGRLGGGINLEVSPVDDLASRLRHVVAEVQASHPSRSIELSVTFSGNVSCDPRRIEQLLSNLLANAIEHGAPQTPIRVRIGGDESSFVLCVENAGDPIPEATRAQLFQPYFRGGQSGRGGGLGLGLYIVAEIAKSHHGKLEVTSREGYTTFTVSMPRLAELGS